MATDKIDLIPYVHAALMRGETRELVGAALRRDLEKAGRPLPSDADIYAAYTWVIARWLEAANQDGSIFVVLRDKLKARIEYLNAVDEPRRAPQRKDKINQ